MRSPSTKRSKSKDKTGGSHQSIGSLPSAPIVALIAMAAALLGGLLGVSLRRQPPPAPAKTPEDGRLTRAQRIEFTLAAVVAFSGLVAATAAMIHG